MLCSVPAAGTALTSPGCSAYCRAALAQHLPSTAPRPAGWVRDISRAAHLNRPKGCPIPYGVTLSNTSWGRARRRGGWRQDTSVTEAFVCPHNRCVYWGPASGGWTSLPDGKCRVTVFSFSLSPVFAFFFFFLLLLPFPLIKLLNLQSFAFFPIVFPLPVHLWRRRERTAWWSWATHWQLNSHSPFVGSKSLYI